MNCVLFFLLELIDRKIISFMIVLLVYAFHVVEYMPRNTSAVTNL